MSTVAGIALAIRDRLQAAPSTQSDGSGQDAHALEMQDRLTATPKER
jgi:hypothetical protein